MAKELFESPGSNLWTRWTLVSLLCCRFNLQLNPCRLNLQLWLNKSHLLKLPGVQGSLQRLCSLLLTMLQLRFSLGVV